MLEWLYVACLLLLAVYGANSLLLTLIYWFSPRKSLSVHGLHPELEPLPEAVRLQAYVPQATGLRPLPTVSVQLPIYNERYVVERLLDAVSRLDYPRDRLHVQILDDSTDETCEIIDRAVVRLQAGGLRAEVIRRRHKVGFKGGALAEGLASAQGEFIAVFDADFVPRPDFLMQTLPHFADPDVGCVQARWEHVDRAYSLLTRIQAAGIDGHFIVEQEARNRLGWFIGFNGSAGIWRKACIDAAGGWQTDTLTEDLDLSYRAQLAGWKLRFLSDVTVPAELPAQFAAFRRQQFRWAKGSIQTARKLLPALWRSRLPFATRFQGTLHLAGYLIHPLVVVVLVLSLPATPLRSPISTLLPLLAITMIGPLLLFGSPIVRRSRSLPALAGTVGMLVLLGTGMSISNTQAALEALLGVRSSFLRTPKFNLRSSSDQWQLSQYALPIPPIVWVELAAAVVSLGAAVASVLQLSHFSPWFLIYAVAFGYVTLLSVWQGIRRGIVLRLRPLPAVVVASKTASVPD